jgi:hypothetical protein
MKRCLQSESNYLRETHIHDNCTDQEKAYGAQKCDSYVVGILGVAFIRRMKS